jgi:hypothetical protein
MQWTTTVSHEGGHPWDGSSPGRTGATGAISARHERVAEVPESGAMRGAEQ